MGFPASPCPRLARPWFAFDLSHANKQECEWLRGLLSDLGEGTLGAAAGGQPPLGGPMAGREGLSVDWRDAFPASIENYLPVRVLKQTVFIHEARMPSLLGYVVLAPDDGS